MFRLRRNQAVDLHTQKLRTIPEREILTKDAGPFVTFFFRCFSHSFSIHLFLFISNSKLLIFSRFFGPKLLNGCLVVWPNNLRLQGRQTSWRFLQRNNFSSSKTSSGRLARCVQNVLEDVKLLRWRRAEDVFNTCFEDVLKTSLRPTNVFWVKPF